MNKEKGKAKKGHAVPQEHWEMHGHLLRGDTSNPYRTYYPRPPTEWPHPQKKFNRDDY